MRGGNIPEEDLLSPDEVYALKLEAEIETLTGRIATLEKALDQAVEVGFIRIRPGHDDWLENEINCSSCFTFDQKPELAEWLRRKAGSV